MQLPIYDRFDLFIENIKKVDLFSEVKSDFNCKVFEVLGSTNLYGDEAVISTQSHVETEVVDKYQAIKFYNKNEVEMLIYKNRCYLLDGHHTYMAWKLDGCPNKLKARLLRFNKDALNNGGVL